MKNITFSANEETIQKARLVAAKKQSTLNQMFREWLEGLNNNKSNNEDVCTKFNELWKQTSYFQVGKKLTREEMNER